MSTIVEQARSNAYARAREVGCPGVLTKCLAAGMPLDKARGVVESAKDKRIPRQWANKCISGWRNERAAG